MKLTLLLFLMFGLVACSGGKSAKDAGDDEAGIELADADEFSEDGEMADGEDDVVASNMQGETAPPTVIPMDGEQKSYTVEKNETLMMVAFKLYGDYGKWKQIAEWNGISNQTIMAGQTLKYVAPAQEFVWSPEGSPYLIKQDDTLGTISNDTYGDTKFWKDIWNNNKPLIKDPNKIFVGFTIYTPTIEGRDVANQ
jgi:nucleoid-associated protein YgaU